MDWRAKLAELKNVKFDWYGKDYLQTWDHSKENMLALLYVAQLLEQFHRENLSCRVFDSGLAVSNFRDKSTRTRFAYASAASLLGLSCQENDESKSQVSHGETVRETANMISFLTEVIGIRDDLFIHEGHKYQKEVADAVEEGFRAMVLPQRPVVVNLQCDRDHPTQSMADLMHLVNHFGGLDKLRGKKIAVTWAYSPSYGKPLSVPQGLIGLLPRFGMNVSLAYPEGYDLLPDIVETAKKFAAENHTEFTVVHSMEEAFKDADVVYPKSWAPFQFMEKRVALLRSGKAGEGALKEVEKELLENNKKFITWECTEEKMKVTKGGNALYCHCLPADISGDNVEHGEVTKAVFEKYRLKTYNEAEHKNYVIAGSIVMSRFHDVPALMQEIGEGKFGHIRKGR